MFIARVREGDDFLLFHPLEFKVIKFATQEKHNSEYRAQ